LMEFAARIPAHLKLRHGRTKIILKNTFKDILPGDIIKRKKMGFGVPLDHWRREESVRLLAPLPNPLHLTNVAYRLRSPLGEERSIPDYRSEVARYLDRATERWPFKLRFHAVLRGLGRGSVTIANPTDENLSDIEVSLRVDGRVGVYFFAEQARAEARMPTAPPLWGKVPGFFAGLSAGLSLSPLAMAGLRGPAKPPGYEVSSDMDGSTITLGGFDLRPRETITYREFFVIAEAPMPTSELILKWRATAKNVSGVSEGELSARVGPLVPLAEVFDEPLEKADEP
ncbi:MAG: hypothetical protein HY216_12035, partial [Candidatus Rokubacteria bacterium]|nr:hypothetical protein [Candidatus Rokubacteria bacterium]